MAIIDITPIAGSRTSSDDGDTVSLAASYSILTDDQTNTAGYVRLNQPFVVGTAFDGFEITSIKIDETEDPCQWTMTIEYGTTENDENPLLKPWVYGVTYEQHQIPVDFDINGTPILNTAGDLFNEVLMKDQARPVLTAKKNYALMPWDLANTYSNKLNSDVVFGAPAKTLKFERLITQQTTVKFEGSDLTYFETSLELAFNPEGWDRKILNQGFRQLADDGNGGYELDPVKIKGKDVSQPVLLDVNGFKTETPHTLTFELYEAVPFAPIFA